MSPRINQVDFVAGTLVHVWWATSARSSVKTS